VQILQKRNIRFVDIDNGIENAKNEPQKKQKHSRKRIGYCHPFAAAIYISEADGQPADKPEVRLYIARILHR